MTEKQQGIIPAVIFAVIIVVIMVAGWNTIKEASTINKILAGLLFGMNLAIIKFGFQYNSSNAPSWNKGGAGGGFAYIFGWLGSIFAILALLGFIF